MSLISLINANNVLFALRYETLFSEFSIFCIKDYQMLLFFLLVLSLLNLNPSESAAFHVMTFNIRYPNPDDGIDYNFIRTPIDVLQHSIVSDSWNGHFASDHLPVLADVGFS